MRVIQTLRPDVKGRVCLGPLSKGISSYHITYDEITGKITLEPFTEIPLQEAWLFQNLQALESVRKGVKQSEEKKLKDRGEYTQYIEEE